MLKSNWFKKLSKADRKATGWKYITTKDLHLRSRIRGKSIVTEYIRLNKDGWLWIKKGYCWDGPSGPSIDTMTFMRASLFHDALYQLIREGWLSQGWRKNADLILRKICKEDKMFILRRFYVYWGVRLFAGWAASPK